MYILAWIKKLLISVIILLGQNIMMIKILPNFYLVKWQMKQHQTLNLDFNFKEKLNFSHSTLFHMKNRVRLKYFVHGFRIFLKNYS